MDSPLDLTQLSLHQPQLLELPSDGLSFFLRGDVSEVQLHHAAFPRMYGTMLRRADEDWRQGTPSPLVGDLHVSMKIGEAPFGLYPPLVVFASDATWVLGQVTQSQSRVLWDWEATHDGLLISARLHEPGTETFFVEKLPPSLLSPSLFEGYNGALRANGAGCSGPLPLTWATWNDGIFRNIDAGRILQTARFLKEAMPAVRFIQIDDGWAPASATVAEEDGALGMSDLASFYKRDLLDHDPRFPGGLGKLSQDLKDLGFRPLIWLTPTADYRSQLYKDHPDWFQPDLRLHFMPHMRFFDYSVPEARAYVEGVFDLVFKTWGYEGCKLDFWSMGFEQPDAAFRNGGTSVEWEHWFLDAIRTRIPEDGLFLHCIDLPFGTPFRSRWFDQFRFYADSEGCCAVESMMKEQALWSAVLVGLYRVSQFWALNGDGLGTFPHIQLSEAGHRRWIALLLASGSLTELAGWLDTAEPAACERMRRATQWADTMTPLDLPGYDYAEMPPEPPSVWVRGGDRPLIGLTNWGIEPMHYQVKQGCRSLFSDEEFVAGMELVIPIGDGDVLIPL